MKARCIIGAEPIIFLGSSLRRVDGCFIEGSKPGYMKGVLDAGGMTDGRAVTTAGVRPMLQTDEDFAPVDAVRHQIYRRVCGKLQYAVPRRPDLLYPLKELGRHLSAPREADLRCLKHTLRYLRGTLDLVMVHKINGDPKLPKGATDSDWAGCAETRKSTCCGVVHWMGVVILSYARTESVLAQSSPEAEYLGAVVLCSEMLYIQCL